METKQQPTLFNNNIDTSKLIILGLSLAILMTSIDTNIVSIGLPTIAKVLNTSFSRVQWIVLSYLLTITILIVGVGRIGDMFGKKKLFLRGIMIFTVASLLCGLSFSINMLIAARVLQGIGGSILMALSFALAGDLIPKEKIAQAMGVLTSMLTLGIALGPSLGGILIRPEQRGVVSGLLNLARTLGLATGASIMGAFFSYFTLRAQSISFTPNDEFSVSLASPEAITAGVHGTFLVAMIFIVVAILIGIFTLRSPRSSSQHEVSSSKN